MEANRVLEELIIKFVDPSDLPGKERQLRKEIDKVRKIGFVEKLGFYVVKVDDLERLAVMDILIYYEMSVFRSCPGWDWSATLRIRERAKDSCI